MSVSSETLTRVAAGFGALALTLTLIVSSFATPHAATFAGVLA